MQYIPSFVISIVVAWSVGLAAAGEVDFSRDIRPILSDNCFPCHGPDEQARESELRLDTKDGLFRRQDGVAVVAPGDSNGSALVRRVVSDDDERMPPADSNLSLSEKQIDLLRQWVEAGAPWKGHWSFQTPTRPVLPDLTRFVRTPPHPDGSPRDTAALLSWPKNEIDYFVLEQLLEKGLLPSTAARKEKLIRRVTLDLTGLPPTWAEVDAFRANQSSDAYEQVVDRLLASPQYGERMAWDWLDAARYADTNGFQGDAERTMWPWRDWVVKALNDNMPFDQFTIEQLAGDLLPGATVDQRVATGFNRNHMFNAEGGRIAEETRVENVFDRVETTATIWMGITMTCCRCHDHKFDPFSQLEYYQLFAFFNNTSESGSSGGARGQIAPVAKAYSSRDRRELDRLNRTAAERLETVARIESDYFGPAEDTGKTKQDRVAALPEEIRNLLRKPADQRSPDEIGKIHNHFRESNDTYAESLEQFKLTLEARRRLEDSVPSVMVMDQLETLRDTFILTRGAYNKPADKVTSDVPASLPALHHGAERNRLALARWLTAGDHPLTARVAVNRYWQMFFGNGFVKTAEDFGVQGEKPSHPELLDWLATEFVRTGWDVKALHKLIVMSATYRQSARVTSELLARDPENRLLARGPRFRLPAWMIRDQALAASGLLVDRLGGPSVRPYQPDGVWSEATFGKKRYEQDQGEKLYRRTLYTYWRRIVGPTMLFDSAKRQTCEVKVARTNTPLHALVTLNDVTYVEAARVMAERTMRAAVDPSERIVMAFRLMTSRSPTSQESRILVGRFEQLRQVYSADSEGARSLLAVGDSPRDQQLDVAEHAAYTGVCLLIMNLDEALTK